MDGNEALRNAQQFVADAMDQNLMRFKPGAKIAVLVRRPPQPDQDFMMTNDMIGEMVELLKRRQKTTRAGAPTKSGFYWAKWKIADEGSPKTEEYNSYLPQKTWEVVEVFRNTVDSADPEHLRVHIAGVSDSQSLENFFWGEGPLEAPL